MGGLGSCRSDRLPCDIADIIIADGLNPGPFRPFLENKNVVAKEKPSPPSDKPKAIAKNDVEYDYKTKDAPFDSDKVAMAKKRRAVKQVPEFGVDRVVDPRSIYNPSNRTVR